ncbi:LOW QUALITY PROTEIN: uncharacterized protein FYW61_016155 [Anableps anableps]
MFLWYMASHNSFKEISDKFDLTQSLLLGDSVYIGQAFAFILTSKYDNGAVTEADEEQNTQISCQRVVVEQAFGCLTCSWTSLHDVQNTRTDVVVMIITAACFLHNLCIVMLPLHPIPNIPS